MKIIINEEEAELFIRFLNEEIEKYDLIFPRHKEYNMNLKKLKHRLIPKILKEKVVRRR